MSPGAGTAHRPRPAVVEPVMVNYRPQAAARQFYAGIVLLMIGLVIAHGASAEGNAVAAAFGLALVGSGAIVLLNGILATLSRGSNRRCSAYPPWSYRVRSDWQLGKRGVYVSQTWHIGTLGWVTVARCARDSTALRQPRRAGFRAILDADTAIAACIAPWQRAAAALSDSEVALVVEGARISDGFEMDNFVHRCCWLADLVESHAVGTRLATRAESSRLSATISSAVTSFAHLLGVRGVARIEGASSASVVKARPAAAFRTAPVQIDDSPARPPGAPRATTVREIVLDAPPSWAARVAAFVAYAMTLPLIYLAGIGSRVWAPLPVIIIASLLAVMLGWLVHRIVAAVLARRWRARLAPSGRVIVMPWAVRAHSRFCDASGCIVDVFQTKRRLGSSHDRFEVLVQHLLPFDPDTPTAADYRRFGRLEQDMIAQLPVRRVLAASNGTRALIVIADSPLPTEDMRRRWAETTLAIADRWRRERAAPDGEASEVLGSAFVAAVVGELSSSAPWISPSSRTLRELWNDGAPNLARKERVDDEH